MKLEFISVLDKNDGYGVTKDFLVKYFRKNNIKLIDKFDHQKKDASFVYSYPANIVWCHASKKICYTMFESDRIPDSWVPQLKQYDLVLVPTKWNRDVFAKSGIKAEVVPLGYNDDVFKPYKRPKRKIFTFLNYESFTIRKGWHELFEAFKLAFRPSEPVRIIFKTTAKSKGYTIVSLREYPNMEVINEIYTPEQMNDLLKQADCLIFPSRGEGFGLPPLEAMATGIPVITPNAHGISEYFDDRFMVDVKYVKAPARYDHIKGEDVGNWIRCDIEDLAGKMREVYNKWNYYRRITKQISDYARNYTAESTVMKLINKINNVVSHNSNS